MNLLRAFLEYPLGPDWRARKAARELSRIGHEKRRNHIREVARQLRRETGLPPHPALEEAAA